MKKETKTLITEIMNEDAKDGLYDVRKINLEEMPQEEWNEARNTTYKHFDIDDDVREDDVEKLLKSLGEPNGDNEYLIKSINNEWYIEYKVIGSGEPLSQWLKNYLPKENTYTEEQVREAIDMAVKQAQYYGTASKEEIIQSLKQPK